MEITTRRRLMEARELKLDFINDTSIFKPHLADRDLRVLAWVAENYYVLPLCEVPSPQERISVECALIPNHYHEVMEDTGISGLTRSRYTSGPIESEE